MKPSTLESSKMKIQEPTTDAFGAIVTDFDAATATAEAV